ncbi:YtkA-like protein [Neobacillus bataviensis]|uniref:YtkA-like protein n=1 Tax=Neobacillus bataviensis TaxID=220685 RepID=A0A561DRR2_9BACI|nr:FixH family protein [Neobacillus bataviensis]TWE06055.1 YtkA-like protein [Neobacillus bataviensis]
MRKIVLILITILSLSVAVSCSNEQENTGDMPEMVDVNLSVKPNPGEANKPIIFEAKVTQGKEKINDAEVTFEVWRSKDPNHEKIALKHAEDGVYRLEKTFQQEGTYYIISHVTARDMHNMPKKEFTIGKPSEKEDSTSDHSMDGMNMDDHKSQ